VAATGVAVQDGLGHEREERGGRKTVRQFKFGPVAPI
jgi:hypothetical protein